MSLDRDELVEAGTRAVKDRYYGTVADATTEGLIRQDVAATVDTVEPLIRADERHIGLHITANLIEEYRDGLRAQVEGLRDEVMELTDPGMSHVEQIDTAARMSTLRDVLALLDGGSE